MSLALVKSEHECGDTGYPIIAKSKSMLKTLKTIDKLTKIDSTVLITGETGTGKTVISKLLHVYSNRSNSPFIKVNCANIPETLLESDIFGHDRGSFTGAMRNHRGKFELAENGILFFDEIGELPLHLQAKILTTIEDKTFQRVGGEKDIYCDTRIIAATNRNIEKMVVDGAFRSDLYYRLNVFRVHIPPLRERKECIPFLSDFFITKYNKIHKTRIEGISTEVSDFFNEYPWFGNVRELSNTIERAVVFSRSKFIKMKDIDLPDELIKNKSKTNKMHEVASDDLMVPINKVEVKEKEMILDALENNFWSQKRASIALGISPRAINYKIKKYGIKSDLWRKNS